MEGVTLQMQCGVKAIFIIIMVSMLFCGAASATNHTVGGVSGWDLTSDIQAWTSGTTFHVGDSLVFSYTPVHDVVEVEEEDYQMCDATEPIRTYNDGETVIPLTQEGSRYFICGRQGHCSMGLKLEAQVLASSPNATQPHGKGNSPGTPSRTPSHPPRSPLPLLRPPPPPKDDGDNGNFEIPPGSPSPTEALGPTSASSPNIIIMPLVLTTLLLLLPVMINIFFLLMVDSGSSFPLY